MPTYGGIEELQRICKEMRLSPKFLSEMLIGHPAQVVVYRWLKGAPIKHPERFTSVLNLARALKQEGEKLHPGFSFYAATARIWRPLMVKAGYPLPFRKEDVPIVKALLARTPSLSKTAGGWTRGNAEPLAGPEPVAFKA